MSLLGIEDEYIIERQDLLDAVYDHDNDLLVLKKNGLIRSILVFSKYAVCIRSFVRNIVFNKRVFVNDVGKFRDNIEAVLGSVLFDCEAKNALLSFHNGAVGWCMGLLSNSALKMLLIKEKERKKELLLVTEDKKQFVDALKEQAKLNHVVKVDLIYIADILDRLSIHLGEDCFKKLSFNIRDELFKATINVLQNNGCTEELTIVIMMYNEHESIADSVISVYRSNGSVNTYEAKIGLDSRLITRCNVFNKLLFVKEPFYMKLLSRLKQYMKERTSTMLFRA